VPADNVQRTSCPLPQALRHQATLPRGRIWASDLVAALAPHQPTDVVSGLNASALKGFANLTDESVGQKWLLQKLAIGFTRGLIDERLVRARTCYSTLSEGRFRNQPPEQRRAATPRTAVNRGKPCRVT
jgi:hypothetical protein